jgi:transketolase
VIRHLHKLPGPGYIRLDKSNDPDIEGLGERFEPGRPEVVCEGSEVLLLATGSISQEANRAAGLLRRAGINPGFAVLAHLGFRGSDALAELVSRYPFVVTVEEGFISGGLGSLVAETIALRGLRSRLDMCGVRVPLISHTGSRDYMRRMHKLDAANIAETAHALTRTARWRRNAA